MNINFQIKQIKTDQFAIFDTTIKPNSLAELITKIEFKIDIEQNMIGTFMTFDFSHENKIFIRLACSCHFQIQKESWTNFLTDKPTITVPKSFLLHLATITTGTSRGILHSKTEGTAFCTLVLPTIDLTQLISTDLEFLI